MLRRMLPLLAALLSVALSGTDALADHRIALVIGNSAYQNVARLDNPRNDALLMASTLKGIGFSLIGDAAQLDLDKAGLDAVVQKFGAALQGADVALFYYAGHGLQIRGANYLVPVGANPVREADVDFQMIDVNVVLRQMEGSGTRLNLVVLDACRNNPFGGRGLRAAEGGLAHMRAPEGTLISFATQPGNVALDGEGDSPFTKALATTVRTPGLDIFQTFNEVGLAVKHATGGSQQPWVSNSPIDGSFYFVPPQPAATAQGARDEAALAWAATRDTTSLAVLDTFIQQYGNSIYAPFARARRDELKNSQVAALSTPRPLAPEPRPDTPRLPRPDVIRLFEPLKQTIGLIEKYYIEQRDEGTLYAAANNALRRAFPPSTMEARFAAADAGKGDLDSVYDAAFAVLNAQTSDNEDNHAVEVAINGVLASLDPYSFYMSALAYRAQQSQTSGTFGGIGVEINVIDGLLRVMSPIDGTPAAKAGILANDVIAAIDGISTQGLPMSALAGRMRGAVGSPVKLKILRDNVWQPIELTIVRDIVRTQSVRAHVEGGDVGYIRITRFDEQTESSFKQAVADISRQAGNALKGYVIDLRNSAGGLLASVTAVADDVMDSGEIASIRGRNAKDDHPVTAHAGDVAGGTRLVVLINGGSASGSEIVAGALQDNHRATIVGTQSRGYGNIRTIFPLGPGHGAVELTTALYYTPSGRSVQATGITPDIEVLQDEPAKPGKAHIAEAALTGRLPVVGVPVLGPAHVVSQSYIPPDPAKDRALVTAVDILRTGSSYPHRCSTGPCAPAWLGPWLLNPRMTGL